MTSFADPGSGASGGDASRSVQVVLDADVSGYSQAIGMAAQQTSAMMGTVDKLGNSMGNLSKMAGRGIHILDVSQSAAMTVATGDAALLEHQLSTLRATSVVTGSSMSEMQKQIDNVFSSFPVSRGQVVQLAETISNLGVTAPKAIGSMANTFEKLGAATGDDPNQLASSNIQLGRQMGNTGADQVAGYANSLLVVSKNQGVAVSGVTEFASAIAPMARAAGIGEAAVIGISGAFQKAGADGAYAANAFNQIMSDITQLSATGSPDLAKYASFVGKDTNKFAKESGTDQATDMFAAITKGGPQALSFMDSLGLGQRGLKAFQAVGQAGGIAQPIAESRAAAGNTDKLDAAAATANKGLSDSIVMVRNQFTMLGEILGGPLLNWSTSLADGFGATLTVVNKVVAAMGPLPGIVSSVFGLLAGPVSFALSHFATIGTLAMARTVLGSNSMPRIAYREGNAAGLAMRGGATREEALSMSRSGQRILAGTANLRTSLPFDMGQRAGERPGVIQRRYGTGAVGALGQGFVGASRAVVGGATWLADQRIQMNRDAGLEGPDRSGNQPKVPGSSLREHIAGASIGNLRRATVRMVGSTAATAASMGASVAGGAIQLIPRYERAAADRATRLAGNAAASAADTTGMNRAEARAARDAARRAAAGVPPPPPPPPPPLTGQAASLAAAGVRMPPAMIRATAAAEAEATAARAAAATRAATAEAEAAKAAAGGGARSMLGRAGGMLGGALFSPLGMIASMVGIPLVSSLISSSKEREDKRNDISGSLTGAQKYDQVLDQTSSNLAKFGDSVTGATDRLNGLSNTPTDQLTSVTADDRTAVKSGDYKLGDETLGTVVRKGTDVTAKGGDKDAVSKGLAAFLDSEALQSGGQVDGARFTKMKQDVFHETNDEGLTNSVMGAFSTRLNQKGGVGATADMSELGKLASVSNQQGGDRQLEDFKNIYGSAVLGLRSGTQKSGDPGGRAELAGTLNLAAQAVGGDDKGQEDRLKSIADYQQKSFSADPTLFAKNIAVAAAKIGATDTHFAPGVHGQGVPIQQTGIKTPEQAMQVVAYAMAQDPKIAKQLGQLGVKDQKGLLALAQTTAPLPPPEADTSNATLSEHGPLGTFAARSTLFQQASTGSQSGQAGAQFAAAKELAAEAAKESGGDLSAASAALMQLSDAIDGGKGPTGQLIKSAQEWTKQLQSFKTPGLSREAQLAQSINTASDSAAIVAVQNKPSDASVAQAKTDAQAANDNQESVRQYMISRIQQVQQFQTGQDRAVAAQALQVGRSNRDFATQQGYTAKDQATQRGYTNFDFGQQQGRSKQDYTTQRGYSQSDFAEQQKRSEFDFNQSRTRSEEDFGLQQVRGVQDANTAKLRAQEDYQQSSQRSQADYQLNLGRQTADHLRDLARQAQAASQDIYNPFLREQVKATTDAGTLIYNLTQQNGDIERQMANLAKLKKMGVSQNTIDTLKLSSTENDQQANTLVESLSQNPNMAGRINALVGKRGTDTTRLTQSFDNIGFRQSQQDYAQQQSRSAIDFTTSRTRAQLDYDKSVNRTSDDFAKSTTRAAADQAKSLSRMSIDFTRSTDLASRDQVKALRRQADEFTKTTRRAADDQVKSLGRMDAESKLTRDRAVIGHKLALTDMATDATTISKYAVADLATSFKQYTGDFNSIFSQLAGSALGVLSKYAPAAAKIMKAELIDLNSVTGLGNKLYATDPTISGGRPTDGQVQRQDPTISGGRPYDGNTAMAAIAAIAAPAAAADRGGGGSFGSAADVGGSGTSTRTSFGHAFGGISLTQHIARVSEHGPELILPLNSRGQDFMTGLITKSLARAITHAVTATPAASTSMSNDNSVNFAGADIKIVAQDPNQMAKELTAKAKLARLASPVRH